MGPTTSERQTEVCRRFLIEKRERLCNRSDSDESSHCPLQLKQKCSLVELFFVLNRTWGIKNDNFLQPLLSKTYSVFLERFETKWNVLEQIGTLTLWNLPFQLW